MQHRRAAHIVGSVTVAQAPVTLFASYDSANDLSGQTDGAIGQQVSIPVERVQRVQGALPGPFGSAGEDFVEIHGRGIESPP